MGKKKTAQVFETMGEVLDHHGIKRTKFGEAVGWTMSTIPMKLNRKRNWSIAEYEKALEVSKRYRLGVTRADMQRFATKRSDDGAAK
jgi:hypothetical protein